MRQGKQSRVDQKANTLTIQKGLMPSFNRVPPVTRKLRLLLTIFMGLLLSTPFFAQANEQVAYQNWIVDIGSETVEAHTANESNSSIGLFCGGTTCVFYLNANIKCQPNHKDAVLMNGSSTSSAISMQCTTIGGHYFEVLDPFEAVLNTIKSSEVIGFAVALEGGGFTVARFSLSGALQAIQRTIDEAGRKGKATPENLTPQNSKNVIL